MRFAEAQDLFAYNRWAAGRTFAAVEALTDAQRQLLARHILQKQAQERRQARDQEAH